MIALIKRLFLPFVVLLGGVAVAVAMVVLSRGSDRVTPPPTVMTVEVLEAPRLDARAEVRATGVVEADRRVALVAEVNGAIVEQSEALRPGGRFAKGDVVARVDPRVYRLALRQQESNLRQAELNLQLEQGRREVAAREWELLGLDKPADDAPLALRKPQLEAAELAVEAARAGVEQARLNLDKTALRAPFNAVVIDESVDIGQVVGPGSPVVTLVGTDRFRVLVSVPVDRLALIDVAGFNAEQGSSVVVSQRLGQGTVVEHAGRVLGLAGQLDPQTRTAQLLVGVDDPLDPADGALPLLPGAFVDVLIQGRTLPDVVVIPRGAIAGGDHVWVVAEGDKLARRNVEIAWQGEQDAYIAGGLDASEPVVTSALSLPIEGQAVRVAEPTQGSADAAPTNKTL